MTSLEKYFGKNFEIVDIIKSDEKNLVANVYDKNSKRLCVMKKRNLNSKNLYKILQKIKSPYIPEIYRIIERDENLIILEEHIDGETLENLLNYKMLNFDEKIVEKILLQICDCLTEIHKENIIHRDITLSNIMLTKNNEIKLIDFGIARIFDFKKLSDTEFLGTRGYAAPEQYGLFDLEQSDFRTDIFVLAMSMKNLLGENYRGYLKKILNRCTSLNPALRYQNISELIRDIKREKKFFYFKKFSFIIFFMMIFFRFQSVGDVEKILSEEVEENNLQEKNIVAEEKNSTPENKLDAELTKQLIEFTKKQPEKIYIPVEQKIEKKTFAKRPKIYFYLNGKITENRSEHSTAGEIILPKNYKTWQQNERGEILFPENFTAKIAIENFTEKDLITPKIIIDINDEKIFYDKPTIKSGQKIDFEIPIAKKIALRRNNHGEIYISLESPSHEKIPLLIRYIEVEENF